MANRRMISKSISTSKKLATVSADAALLFTWIIPHCDDNGNMDAEPIAVKGIVVPMRTVSVGEVGKQLDQLKKVGLILLYEAKNGEDELEKFLHINKFEKHQTLRGDRPDFRYPPCGLPLVDQRLPDGKPNGTEQNRTEQNLYSKNFEDFWNEYPRKVGKGAAWKSWDKIKGISKDIIIKAVKAQRNQEQWQKDNGQYIPHPSTWLNQRRWEDEIIKVQKEVSFK